MLYRTRGFAAKVPDTPPKTLFFVTGVALVLVAVLTAALVAATLFFEPEHVTIIYLVPVLYAAIRGGIVPAVIASLAGVVALLFFFYPPLFDHQTYNPVNIVDLVLFVIVSVITGHLAANVRRSRIRA